MTNTKWKLNEAGVINNMRKVLESGNIEYLNDATYKFTSLLSGFIAHYNLYGFRDEYRNVADLIRDLENSSDINRPEYYTQDKYFYEGNQSEYYASKSRVLIAFKGFAEKYKKGSLSLEEQNVESKWNQLQELTSSKLSVGDKKLYLNKLGLI